MLPFILAGLCLLQFQVSYSSYTCPESKPTCFPNYDPISTNEIRDDPFCSKQSKKAFLILQPKTLHRFQPFFLRHREFNSPSLFDHSRACASNLMDPENRITDDDCGLKSQERPNPSNVPEALMEVQNQPTNPEETVYEDEAPKQCSIPVDTQERYSEHFSNEPLPEDGEVPTSLGPISVDTEGQEEPSSMNPSDNNPFVQCSTTEGPFNDKTPSLTPSETDGGIESIPTETYHSEGDNYVQKLEECSESLGGQTSGSSCSTQINPETIVGVTQLSQLSVDHKCKPEITLSFPAQSISLDTACENVSSSAGLCEESSSPLFNIASATPTTTLIKESFSGTEMPTTTGLDQITCKCDPSEIANKLISKNPMCTTITNQCTNVLSNMLTGLSSINSNISPSPVKPIYEEIIRHVPTVRNVVRHHVVETTHHVPIVEKIVQHERQDIIRHIPVVQKFTRNVVDCCTKHVPIIQHRARTVEEPYIDHVTHTQKITRPVIETLVKHVPVVCSRYRPVVHERIRHVPTVQTRFVPVVEQSITTVPVKQKVIKHVIEDQIRPIVEPWEGSTLERTQTPPCVFSSGLGHHGTY